MKLAAKLVLIGMFAGIVLGGFLKLIESVTHKKVYVLLLNVDYIPVLKHIPMNELQEFLLHLAVSIGVVYVVYLLITGRKHPLVISALVNIIAGIFLFVTTALSDRTPDLLDGSAFLYWVSGHAFYGIIAGVMITSWIGRG